MQRLFNVLLNFIFPARCLGCRQSGSYLCDHCFFTLARSEAPPDGTITVFDYADPRVRQLIWHLKYRGVRSIAEQCARALYDPLIEHLADQAHFYPDAGTWLIIPAPLHRRRLAKRGFNQSTLIARCLVALNPSIFTLAEQSIAKVRATPTQVSQSSRAARLKNIHNAFRVADPGLIAGRNIILLDDVTTTGATLSELTQITRAAKAARVIQAAVARG